MFADSPGEPSIATPTPRVAFAPKCCRAVPNWAQIPAGMSKQGKTKQDIIPTSRAWNMNNATDWWSSTTQTSNQLVERLGERDDAVDANSPVRESRSEQCRYAHVLFWSDSFPSEGLHGRQLLTRSGSERSQHAWHTLELAGENAEGGDQAPNTKS